MKRERKSISKPFLIVVLYIGLWSVLSFPILILLIFLEIFIHENTLTSAFVMLLNNPFLLFNNFLAFGFLTKYFIPKLGLSLSSVDRLTLIIVFSLTFMMTLILMSAKNVIMESSETGANISERVRYEPQKNKPGQTTFNCVRLRIA